MKHRNLSPMQRKRINRAIRFLRDSNRYNRVTSVRVTLNESYGSFVSMTLTTRRSDCHADSPRQVLCRQRLHLMITRRGKVTVGSASDGLTDNSKHVALMLGGHVRA